MTRVIPKVHLDGEWVPITDGDKWEPPTPENNKKLWRYRSLEQYVSFLDREKLWFSRSDNFIDPYEGSVPHPNISARLEEYETEKAIEKVSDSRYLMRYMTYLNCWHMNEHESDAMWKEYGGERGISIISTPKKLKRSINSLSNFEFGKVSYKDYKSDRIPLNNTISPFYHKRKAFEHEQEYRILYRDFDGFPEEGVPQSELHNHQKPGKSISVDIDTLVEKVIISPTAPDWLAETVESVTEKYEHEFPVLRSKMEEKPRF